MDLLDDFVFGNLFVRAGLYGLVKAHTIRTISDDLHISDYSMISDDCQGKLRWEQTSFIGCELLCFSSRGTNCYVGGATSRIYDGRAAPEAYRTDLSQGAAALKVYIIELIWRDMRLKV